MTSVSPLDSLEESDSPLLKEHTQIILDVFSKIQSDCLINLNKETRLLLAELCLTKF